MIKLVRTDSFNKDFIDLVQQLEKDLARRDGRDYSFNNPFNGIDIIKHVVIAYEHDEPVACGALIEFQLNTMEIKYMFTIPTHRGKGIASMVLLELEDWAKGMTYNKCVLEMGIKQPEAIALYLKHGYRKIPNYKQYEKTYDRICCEKDLRN